MAEQTTIKSFFGSPVAKSSATPVKPATKIANSSATPITPASKIANVEVAPAAKKLATPRARQTKLAAARLQAVSAAQLEKKIEALRSKLPQHARVVVYSLCWRLRCGSADEYVVLNESNGPAFDTFKAQTVLSYYELMGMVNASATIADALMDAEDTHVLVVDATPKADFARLASGFAAITLKIAHNGAIKAPAPSNPLFVAALAAAKVCTTTSMLYYTMEAHFDAHMAYEVEPVGDDDSGEGVAKKAKKPRKA